MDFNKEIVKIMNEKGWHGITPSSLIRKWTEFVEECEEGYTGSIYYFDNELSTRDKLQILLDSEILKKYPEYMCLHDNIEKLDLKLINMFSETYQREGRNWWNKGILRYSGSEYCSDVAKLYFANIDKHD